jgi:hypothetical protein
MVSFTNMYNCFLADGNSFFYALISFLGIIAFFGSMKAAKTDGKSFRSMLKDVGVATWVCLWTFLIGINKIWIGLLAVILYYLPVAFFRCLPLSVKVPVRSVWRHGAKVGIGAEQKAEIMMIEFKTEFSKKRHEIGRYQGGDGQHSPNEFAKFLGVYDMLILVTGHLHYIDITNLSRVSKSVRESVLPSHDLARRLTVFKLYACLPAQKLTCWTCSNQICADCQQLPEVPQTTVLHHLESCQPCCIPCYKTHILRPSSTVRLATTSHCTCAPIPKRPRNPYTWFMNGNGYYIRSQSTLKRVARPVCRECNKRTSKELLARREKWAKMQLKLGLKSNGEKWTTCSRADCGRALGTGPRYWVCKRDGCGKECASSMHKALGWGLEGEALFGEEAV